MRLGAWLRGGADQWEAWAWPRREGRGLAAAAEGAERNRPGPRIPEDERLRLSGLGSRLSGGSGREGAAGFGSGAVCGIPVDGERGGFRSPGAGGAAGTGIPGSLLPGDAGGGGAAGLVHSRAGPETRSRAEPGDPEQELPEPGRQGIHSRSEILTGKSRQRLIPIQGKSGKIQENPGKSGKIPERLRLPGSDPDPNVLGIFSRFFGVFMGFFGGFLGMWGMVGK